MKKTYFLFYLFVGFISYAHEPIGLPGCTKACPIGLKNCGNTCWMNAALQCLFNMDEFNDHIQKITYPQQSLAASYQDVYQKYKTAQKTLGVKVIGPLLNGMYKELQKRNRDVDPTEFALGKQLDSAEGFTILLDNIVDGFPQISNLLQIKEKQKIFDVTQKNVVSITEKTQSLFLSLNATKGKEYESLFNLLNNYFGYEEVTYGEPLTKYYKKYFLNDLSEYLIINIAIFSYDWGTGEKFKIDWIGTVPMQLNMSSFFESILLQFNTEYTLIGAIAHSGTLDWGHYVAYVLRNTEWYYCSDDIVERVKYPLEKGGTPYLLVYKSNAAMQQLTALAESLQELSKET